MSKTLGLIFPLIIIAILAIAAYQTINGDFLLGAKAGDPCSSYTRQKPLGTASGIVASKQDGQFIWNLNGDSTKPKVVVLCARTKITKKLGSGLAYADIKVGDRLELLGWYGDTTKSTVLPAWIRDISSSSPFGVMTWGDSNSTKIQIATNLEVKYYRPLAVILNTDQTSCTECQAAKDKGFKLVLTIRANGGGGNPTAPPTDWNTYKNRLSQVLDNYQPEVLVIENEENSNTFYTGSPQQYLNELKVGCEIAHSKNIKCTNGGLVSKLVVALVSESYKPDTNKADDYLRRALTPEDYATVSTSIGSPLWLSQIQRGRDLLAGYKTAGADFVNFHWHQENAETIPEAVAYLSTASQGLPVINNEISPQKSISPNQVTSFMQKMLDLRLPYAVWYSNDADGIGGPTALTDKGGNLNDSGKTYQQFIRKSY